MSRFKKYWAKQFARPEGIGGKVSTFLMNRMNGAMYDAVLANVPESGRILEIGFGNGLCIEQLAKRTDAEIYGIDVSTDMLKAAAKRNRKSVRKGKVSLMIGSAEEIPFDGQFDLIYTVNTVYFWPDLDKGHRAIADRLAGGGTFMNVFYTKERLDRTGFTQYGFAKYTPDELKDAAERSGMSAEVIRIKDGASYSVKATR
ncbi:MAG: class I SAM-dependent methyltransferase [Methanomassiliicoccaceae archaeon]|jgi:SAM-dependent methyltransferase|nr:class I SAM-dependent methyltransferase [Methanomassiliicoccaceae archaeon]